MTAFDSPQVRIGGEGIRFGNPAFVIGERGAAFGTGGSVPAPYPAPSGYRWEFVTENAAGVTESGQPVVELVRVS